MHNCTWRVYKYRKVAAVFPLLHFIHFFSLSHFLRLHCFVGCLFTCLFVWWGRRVLTWQPNFEKAKIVLTSVIHKNIKISGSLQLHY